MYSTVTSYSKNVIMCNVNCKILKNYNLPYYRINSSSYNRKCANTYACSLVALLKEYFEISKCIQQYNISIDVIRIIFTYII